MDNVTMEQRVTPGNVRSFTRIERELAELVVLSDQYTFLALDVMTFLIPTNIY